MSHMRSPSCYRTPSSWRCTWHRGPNPQLVFAHLARTAATPTRFGARCSAIRGNYCIILSVLRRAPAPRVGSRRNLRIRRCLTRGFRSEEDAEPIWGPSRLRRRGGAAAEGCAPGARDLRLLTAVRAVAVKTAAAPAKGAEGAKKAAPSTTNNKAKTSAPAPARGGVLLRSLRQAPLMPRRRCAHR